MSLPPIRLSLRTPPLPHASPVLRAVPAPGRAPALLPHRDLLRREHGLAAGVGACRDLRFPMDARSPGSGASHHSGLHAAGDGRRPFPVHAGGGGGQSALASRRRRADSPCPDPGRHGPPGGVPVHRDGAPETGRRGGRFGQPGAGGSGAAGPGPKQRPGVHGPGASAGPSGPRAGGPGRGRPGFRPGGGCAGGDEGAFPPPRRLGLAGLAGTFAVHTLVLQARRRRGRSDATLRFWQMAMVALLVAVAAALAGVGLGAESLVQLAGLLLLAGVFPAVMMGRIYKIVPFVVWLHLKNRMQRPPLMPRIIPEAGQVRHVYLHLAAVLLLLPAPWVPVLAVPGGILLAASNLWMLRALVGALRCYRASLAEASGRTG